MNGPLITAIAGWFPAIILPLATFMQLNKVIQTQDIQGVSALSWFLFGVANVGAYIFAEKYFSIQAIMAFALSAVLDGIIVMKVLQIQRQQAASSDSVGDAD